MKSDSDKISNKLFTSKVKKWQILFVLNSAYGINYINNVGSILIFYVLVKLHDNKQQKFRMIFMFLLSSNVNYLDPPFITLGICRTANI